MNFPFLILLLGFVYLVFIVLSVLLWDKKKEKVELETEPSEGVTVLVIARNESQHIQDCLKSIDANSYPNKLFEIILIDDHSEDDTVELALDLNIQNLRILPLANYELESFSDSFKKAAQYYGISESKYDFILQTDADCVVPQMWISNMSSCLQGSDIVTGPIKIVGSDDFLSKWQAFEMIGTMVLTFVGITMKFWFSANAANMAYRKNVFTNYFENNPSSDIASGDDMFFVNWAQRNEYRVSLLLDRDVTVSTFAMQTLKELTNQRTRWATKTTSYKSSGIKSVMSCLFLFHLLVLLVISLSPFLGYSYFLVGLGALIFKWLGDCILLSKASPFFGYKYRLLTSPIFSMFHTLYVVYIGIVGVFVTDYKWKGRQTR